ncbi:dynein light chain Tctex-type 5-like [Sycon ciliatum]|uniref:dynein light chain Tctex-type 5-like n=1 Tax=Sycon ciliatum TaxID=27933 RepID=UPI0031F64156
MRKSPRKQKNNAVGVGGEDGEDRYIVEIMEYSSEEEESDEMPLTQPEVHFPITKVEKELSQILQGGMDKLTMYEPEEVSDMCQQLANDARDLAKRSGASERYRYVAQAKIGAINGGGMLVGTKCLWDVETDTFVHASYRNRHDLFGVLVIHALYKD